MKYNVVVWPRRSSQVTFKELAAAFTQVLSCTSSNTFITDPDTTNIVLGANDSLFEPRTIPENSIIVNFEQLGPGQFWNKPKYIQLLKNYPVWDYSLSNIKYLSSLGITDISKIDIGYTLNLETCPPAPVHQDIDVLFFGALNKRRRDIGITLKSLGLKVVFTANCFGEKRDLLISRSKVVLNIHYYESKILEVVRLSHLLANKKCVISEQGNEDCVNKVWGRGLVLCDYSEIVSNVLIYLFCDKQRHEQEERAYDFIIQHPLLLPVV